MYPLVLTSSWEGVYIGCCQLFNTNVEAGYCSSRLPNCLLLPCLSYVITVIKRAVMNLQYVGQVIVLCKDCVSFLSW
jgi:hypothetical protein